MNWVVETHTQRQMGERGAEGEDPVVDQSKEKELI